MDIAELYRTINFRRLRLILIQVLIAQKLIISKRIQKDVKALSTKKSKIRCLNQHTKTIIDYYRCGDDQTPKTILPRID